MAMPCGGKCMYQNQYNQFVCICPEPFYLDVDGISCILEKDTTKEDLAEILEDFDRSQSSTATIEEIEEADLHVNDHQTPKSTKTEEVAAPRNEQLSTTTPQAIKSELDLIIFPGTILSSESSSKEPEEANTTATTTFMTTTTSMPTSSTSSASSTPVITKEEISTPSSEHGSIVEERLDVTTVKPSSEIVDLEIIGQDVISKSNTEIAEADNDKDEIAETTTSTLIQIEEDSFDLRGIQAPEDVIEDEHEREDSAINATETVPLVSNEDIMLSKQLPDITSIENTNSSKETTVNAINEPSLSTENTSDIEDKLNDAANKQEDIVNIDGFDFSSTKKPSTSESTTKDFGFDLLTSMLLEPKEVNNATENSVDNKELYEEKNNENEVEATLPTLENSDLTTEPPISSSSSTTSDASLFVISTTKSDENDKNIGFDDDAKLEIESIETTGLPLTIEENEASSVGSETEENREFQDNQQENIISSSTERGDNRNGNEQVYDATTFIVDVLKNAEESEDGTITAGIAVELSSEDAPTTVAHDLELTTVSIGLDNKDINNNEPLGKTENLPIPVTKSEIPETTTPGSTNLLIPIDDSATVNITIPLIDESADADELEKKLREILNTVSEEFNLEEIEETTEDQNSVTIQINEEENTDDTNAILEESTTPKEEVLLKKTQAGTPRKLDFGTLMINQLFETEQTNGGTLDC